MERGPAVHAAARITGFFAVMRHFLPALTGHIAFTSQNSRAFLKDRVGVYQHLRVINIFSAHPLDFGLFSASRLVALRPLFCLICVSMGRRIEKPEYERVGAVVPG